MSNRTAIRAAKCLREMLVVRLGGKCDECGSTVDLEIDHKEGRDWTPREVDIYSRVLRYWKEFLRGVALRVLCASCNGTDARRFRGGGRPLLVA